MKQQASLPLYATGHSLCEEELIACQQLALALPKATYRIQGAQAGTRQSRFKGRGMEFDEVRLYQAGDDVRNIDWRVTARTGKAHTKLYHEEKERPIVLMADLGQQSHMGTQLLFQSVQIAHVCATLAWRALQQGDKIGALCTHEYKHIECKPKARRIGLSTVLQSLLDIHQVPSSQSAASQTEHYLKATLQRVRQIAKPGAEIWIVTDGMHLNQACFDEMIQLKQHCNLALVLVTDPLRRGEVQLSKHVNLPVLSQGQYQVLNQKAFQAWLKQQQQQLHRIKHQCQLMKITPRHICSGQPLAQQIMELR